MSILSEQTSHWIDETAVTTDWVEVRPEEMAPDQEERLAGTKGIGLHFRAWLPHFGTTSTKTKTETRTEVENRDGNQTEAGTVLLVHGYGEHLGRYGRLARQLTRHGFRVGGCDHPGMGRSEGSRMYIDDYATYVDGMMVAHNRLRQGVDPSVPSFVFGHSMGGLVVLLHALDYSDRSPAFAGTVLSGPLLGIGIPVPSWQVKLGNFLIRCAPRFHFPLPIRPNMLSHDEEERHAARTDPHLPGFTTPGWFFATIRAMERAREQATKVNWPTLWMIGGADRVCSPVASREVFDRLTGPDQTVQETPTLVKRYGLSARHRQASGHPTQPPRIPHHHWYEYPGLLHELHRERQADRDRALKDLVTWLRHAKTDA